MLLILFSISTDILLLNPSDTSEIYLGHSFILTHSDSIWQGGILLSGDSLYTIDYSKGMVKFKSMVEETFTIKFSYLNFPVKKAYSRWSLSVSDRSMERLPTGNPIKDKGNLIIKGNKGVFVDVKSGGADVSQSLWMKLGGKAGNFNISGVLSDENIPEGSGASQNISEIDEIFVQAESEEASFRLGDIESMEEGVKKRLIGLEGSWKEFSSVVGVSPGKYGKVTFRGEEGNRGPYFFNPQGTSIDFSIVRGSEQVYLDGRLLKRGRDKDYVVDYSEGAITFNPTVFIDNESTILILFEYYQTGVSNLFYKASFNHNNYNFSFIRQEDFKGEEFSEVYPDSGFGYNYSATFVGEGNGDYDLEDSIFLYKGNKMGSYEVYFNWVGESKGEYIYIDSLHSFRWTGAGPYSAKKKLDLPGENNLLTSDFEESKGDISLSGKLKVRRYRNQFGGVNEDGFSGNLGTSFSPNRFFNLDLNYYRRTPNFKTREWEGEKDLLKAWELKDLPPELIEYTITSKPTPGIRGLYSYGSTVDSLRRDIITINFLPVYLDWRRIKGAREEVKGGLLWKSCNLYLRRLSRDDRYKNEAAFSSSPLFLGVGLEGDRTGDTAQTYTVKTDLAYKNTTLQASQQLRRNLKSGEIRGMTNGTLRANLTLLFFCLRNEFNISQRKSTEWERYYQEVDPGEGNYSYDSTGGTYYENPYGEYIQKMVPIGEGIDTREYSGNISLWSTRYIELHSYLNSIYRPNLFLKNISYLNLKFPKESSRKFFLKYDHQYLEDKEGRWGREQNNDKIEFGLEERGRNYREVGIMWNKSREENKIGAYLHFWHKSGLEIQGEGMRIAGEDTLFSPELKMGYHLSGKKSMGMVQGALGYNYYPGWNITSYRMMDLYPPRFFYDFTTSLTIDITKDFHLVLNTNIHKLGKGKVYYNGRIGVTADFIP